MGQAAGVIAAPAVERRVQPRAVGPAPARMVLPEAGATPAIDALDAERESQQMAAPAPGSAEPRWDRRRRDMMRATLADQDIP